MAAEQQIEYILKQLQKSHPDGFFRMLDKGSAGADAVLRCLHEAGGALTAGNLSEFLHVSTARVAVLIRKLTGQGLVTRESAPNDARIAIIRITPAGVGRIIRMKNRLYAYVGEVIDKVGMERIMEFLSISEEIRAAVAPPDIGEIFEDSDEV